LGAKERADDGCAGGRMLRLVMMMMSSVIFFTFRLYPLLFDYFKSERTSSIVLMYRIFLSAGDSIVEASARAVSVLGGSRL
jgi:uncharacterized protein with PQ loop repeat